MSETTTAIEPFTDAHEKTLTTLQNIQKANHGRMESARRAIESTDAKIRELLDHKFAAMLPIDYLAEDAYDDFYVLMRVQGSDVAHRVRHDYILSLDPHFHYEEYETDTKMPVIRLEVPYDSPDEALQTLSARMVEWTNFRTRHEGEKTPAVMFKVFDYDMTHYGTHWLRVFPDGTAQRVLRHWDNSLDLDQDRRPLPDVLATIRSHWYYPAESNPKHQDMGRGLFGSWSSGREDDEDRD